MLCQDHKPKKIKNKNLQENHKNQKEKRKGYQENERVLQDHQDH